MRTSVVALLFLLLCAVQQGFADYGGPRPALRAVSPDLELIVRITEDQSTCSDPKTLSHRVAIYQFDEKSDAYLPTSEVELHDVVSQFLFISNDGDLIFINIGGGPAVRLYSKAGKLRKSWELDEFLTEEQIEACAQTGSTLQWFDEGDFFEFEIGDQAIKQFHFAGPSRGIRALGMPFTVMRGVDENVRFAGSIDLQKAELSAEEVVADDESESNGDHAEDDSEDKDSEQADE